MNESPAPGAPTPDAAHPAPAASRPGSTVPTSVKGAWWVWGIGVAAYVVAVLQRTSFGVAGIDAAERFTVAPAALAGFVVLQIVVYAGMQIPSGVLLDRYGSRVMIVVGALVMAAGQALLATTDDLAVAYLARVLVGAGDAATFVSVLRLVPAWFPDRKAPLISQLTGILGQLGQVLSAVPLVMLLGGPGWTAAFGSAAALGVLAAVLAVSVVRDGPRELPSPRGAIVPIRQVPAQILTVWKRPGTRLGFYTHMGTQFSLTTFLLMWGVPYLTTAQGMSTEAAGAMLTLSVVVGIVAGPVLGVLSGRYTMHRSWLVLPTMAANALMWGIVIALPERAPWWVLVLLVVVMTVGGPASMIGMDYARYFNPATTIGTAQSIVNMGGFIAALFVVLMMGVVLDARGGYSFDAFRWAWAVQYVVWIVAGTGVLVARRKARRELPVQPRTLRQVLTRSPRGDEDMP